MIMAAAEVEEVAGADEERAAGAERGMAEMGGTEAAVAVVVVITGSAMEAVETEMDIDDGSVFSYVVRKSGIPRLLVTRELSIL